MALLMRSSDHERLLNSLHMPPVSTTGLREFIYDILHLPADGSVVVDRAVIETTSLCTHQEQVHIKNTGQTVSPYNLEV
jgi:hypothetical protein